MVAIETLQVKKDLREDCGRHPVPPCEEVAGGSQEVKGGHCHTPVSPNISLVKTETSQLEGPTPANAFGFKVSQSALRGSHDLHDVRGIRCGSGVVVGSVVEVL